MADVMEVINKLEGMGAIRTKKINGEWYTIYCPFHKNGQESNPSCGISISESVKNGVVKSKGHFHCFTCGYSKRLEEAVKDLISLKGITGKDLEWLKENVLDNSKSIYDDSDGLVPDAIMSNLVSKYALEYISSKVGRSKKYVSEEELAGYRFTVPYMYERGLTDEIIERYDIGFDANHIPDHKNKAVPCITFPVRDRNGNCLFIFRRSVEGRYFNYPKDVEKPVYGIYELDKNVSTVVICESAFNMMTCIRHGYAAVALFGTGTPYQIKQLKELGAKRFVLALDPDEAGHRGMERLRKGLSCNAFISELVGIPSGKDINDLTDDEFEKLRIE